MTNPDLECPVCGFTPIRSGLTACRVCGATITYSDRGLAAFLGILGTAALCRLPMVAAVFSEVGALIGLGAGFVVFVLVLDHAKRVENRNKANEQAYFNWAEHSQ